MAVQPAVSAAVKKAGLLGSLGSSGKAFGVIGGLATLWMGAGTYKSDRERGMNMPMAFAHAAADTVFTNMFFGPIMAASALPLLPIAAQAIQDRIGAQQRSLMPMSQWGDGKADTQQLQTTRQRSLQAIASSRLDARTFVGNEASMFHNRYR